MSTPLLERSAQTEHPILDVLIDRWSPRAFEAETPIDEDKLSSALEAARWAPSAANTQPWRFIVARRGTALHQGIHASLLGYNKEWAGNAGVLIVAITETAKSDGTPLTHALYDLGQAVAHLSVQAHHDGLVVHQMSGFLPEQIRELVDLEARFEPTTVIALGELGDASTLSDFLRERESAPRVRRSMSETVVASA